MITVQTIVHVPVEKAWEFWTKPEHIVHWNFASADWESPSAENDLQEGGRFKYRMSAKDGSASFDFEGAYVSIQDKTFISYTMDDGRKVSVSFEPHEHGTKITESFDPENENPEEMQRSGWQAILDQFKAYCEANS
ncbi:SRPBCC family protein [Candidatus Uhrbacteria bacterium]|nr:SRPBCC family protein [Candidatus Uhrbacteria bacterium]